MDALNWINKASESEFDPIIDSFDYHTILLPNKRSDAEQTLLKSQSDPRISAAWIHNSRSKHLKRVSTGYHPAFSVSIEDLAFWHFISPD